MGTSRSPARARAVVVVVAVASAFASSSLAGPTAAPGGRRAAPRTGLLEPAGAELVAAVRRGDRAEVERIVERMGPARMTDALGSRDPAVVGAAAQAATALPGAVRLLAPLAKLTASDEAATAADAARAIGRILDGADPASLADWEVPPDVVSSTCDALRALALRAAAPVPVRLAALDAVADAGAVCTATGVLVPLLADPSPALRRAAALAVRSSDRPVALRLVELLSDPDALVASAAAAALCRRASGRLDPALLTAARIRVINPTTPVEDAIDQLACLGASKQPEDLKIMGEIAAHKGSPLARRAGELTRP